MSTEIKVYLTNIQTEDNLCFHAIVNSKDDYDMFVDLNETYEILMVDALKGNLALEYFDKENFDKHLFEIATEDYEQNLNLFVQFLNDFYGLTAVTQSTTLCEHFGVRLVGAGFRGNQNSPMLETAQFSAMHSIPQVIKQRIKNDKRRSLCR